MQISSHAIYPFRVPLRIRFSQANQSTQRSDSIILQLNSKDGKQGYGEACPRPYVTGEDFASVVQDIKAVLPLLLRRTFRSFAEVQVFIFQEASKLIRPAALCLLEIAILDLWGKTQQQSLAHSLAITYSRQVHYSGIVPLDKPAKLSKILPLLQAFAFRELKLKLNHHLDDCLAMVNWVKEHWGESFPIRVDANTGWTYEQALKLIPALIEAGVKVIEQPLAISQDHKMIDLCRRFGGQVKLMADESLTTFSSGERLVEQGCFNHYNLKISKNGGILATIRLYRYLQANGFTAQLGAHFGETSILTAAGLWVSAAAPELIAHEGGLGTWLLQRDLQEKSLRMNQEAKLSLAAVQGHGLGLSVRREALLHTETKVDSR
ncbi:MAG: enolase C-terminal domain-like protein [Bacteroidota bacterium]